MKPKFFLSAAIILTLNYGQKNNTYEKYKPGNYKFEFSDSRSNNIFTDDRIFDIKAAKIEFKFTGGMEQGKETLYFDDYGNIAVLLIDKKNKFNNNKRTMIWKNKQTTDIDHEKKIVTKSPFRNKNTEAPPIVAISETTRKNIGYEKMPNETIAGKSCEVWYNKKLNVKYWIWKKIDLKKINQGLTKEAVSVEEIKEIPASVMQIPKDYKQ
jgi:hypothetical protein